MTQAAVRVLCIKGRSMLLVTGASAWELPRAQVDPSETNEQAAARALLEQCGIRARLLRRVPAPMTVRGLAGDFLVMAETDTDVPPTHEGRAAFHGLNEQHPVGPLDLWQWGGLGPLIANAAYQSRWIGAHSQPAGRSAA